MSEKIRVTDIDEKTRKKLAEYIEKLREERGLGFNQLSIKSGLNARTLNEITKGESKRTNPFHLQRLGNALRIDYKELYKIVGYLDEGDFQEDEKLKEEVANLKQQLQECENNLVIHHNHNTGNQILGTNMRDVNISVHAPGTVSDELDISGLSEEKLEDLKKFIKYLKNSD